MPNKISFTLSIDMKFLFMEFSACIAYDETNRPLNALHVYICHSFPFKGLQLQWFRNDEAVY